MDDSGTRHPDHNPTLPAHGRDWFALGGILIDEADEIGAKEQIEIFRARWPQLRGRPLHSSEIRARTENFRWLQAEGEAVRSRFLSELGALLHALPVVGMACVVNRPGYNARYREVHGRQLWSLCRTAFIISVERAAKFAMSKDAKLRVYPERCTKESDNMLKRYYNELRTSGPPFNPQRSAKYDPATIEALKSTLYEFRPKSSDSPLIQIADLYLWPICIGGYDPKNRPYQAFKEHGKLIDSFCGDASREGIKYSCFDTVP
jgi:hypothetical protein